MIQKTTTNRSTLPNATGKPEVYGVARCLHHIDLKDPDVDNRAEFFKVKQSLLASQKTVLPKGVVSDIGLDKMIDNTKSVVMVVHKRFILEAPSSNNVLIWSTPLFDRKVTRSLSICREGKYAQQRSAFSVGSGFFINNNIIATAAHVVVRPNYDIRDYRFVHGIIKGKETDFSNHIIVNKAQVWRPTHKHKKLSSRRYQLFAKGADWALINVKPAYIDHATSLVEHTSVTFDKDRTPKKGDGVYSIGHGLGLTMKMSYNGNIIKVDLINDFFECNLTLLGGSSGSPIFYTDDHSLAGVCMRGPKKLIIQRGSSTEEGNQKSCLIVKAEDQLFEGQECQKIQTILHALNALS